MGKPHIKLPFGSLVWGFLFVGGIIMSAVLELSIEQQIDLKREEMLKTAKIYGMRSEKTLKISEELDQLIIMYLSNKE